MLSALLIARARHVSPPLRAPRGGFRPPLGAGAFLILLGTLAYVGQGWSVVDALYFAVSTLTTTSVSDPDLVLDEAWVKIFTILYQLIGIGILVEILRRLGLAFVAVRAEERAARAEEESGSKAS